MPTARDDLATLTALGVLAATVAAFAHEWVGHGGMCLARGGEITLLTSVIFRCQGGGAVTDLAGPLGGLACGLAAFALIKLERSASFRLFLLTTGAIALFWYFGQLAESAVIGAGDWGFAAKALDWPAFWRPVAVVLGVGGYLLTVALATREARVLAGGDGAARRLLVPYLAAAASAVIAGALWDNDRAGSTWEGLLAVGIAPLGYLWAVRFALRTPGGEAVIPRSWPWIVVAAALFLAFCLTAGLGLGRLA
jgi:hypothetical protein